LLVVVAPEQVQVLALELGQGQGLVPAQELGPVARHRKQAPTGA